MTAANPLGWVPGELLEGRLPRHAASFENRGPGFRIAQIVPHNASARAAHSGQNSFGKASSRRYLKQQAKRNVSDPFRIAAIRNTLRIAN